MEYILDNMNGEGIQKLIHINKIYWCLSSGYVSFLHSQKWPAPHCVRAFFPGVIMFGYIVLCVTYIIWDFFCVRQNENVVLMIRLIVFLERSPLFEERWEIYIISHRWRETCNWGVPFVNLWNFSRVNSSDKKLHALVVNIYNENCLKLVISARFQWTVICLKKHDVLILNFFIESVYIEKSKKYWTIVLIKIFEPSHRLLKMKFQQKYETRIQYEPLKITPTVSSDRSPHWPQPPNEPKPQTIILNRSRRHPKANNHYRITHAQQPEATRRGW